MVFKRLPSRERYQLKRREFLERLGDGSIGVMRNPTPFGKTRGVGVECGASPPPSPSPH